MWITSRETRSSQFKSSRVSLSWVELSQAQASQSNHLKLGWVKPNRATSIQVKSRQVYLIRVKSNWSQVKLKSNQAKSRLIKSTLAFFYSLFRQAAFETLYSSVEPGVKRHFQVKQSSSSRYISVLPHEILYGHWFNAIVYAVYNFLIFIQCLFFSGSSSKHFTKHTTTQVIPSKLFSRFLRQYERLLPMMPVSHKLLPMPRCFANNKHIPFLPLDSIHTETCP